MGTTQVSGDSPRIQRLSLTEQIADDVERRILAGEFTAGDALPSEDAVAEDYGVSRPVVREAFARLAGRGLIEARTGTGSFVSAPSSEHLLAAFRRYLRHRDAGEPIEHLYEARAAVEVTAAILAAQRATESDVAEMRTRLDAQRSAQDPAAWARADAEFHVSIAHATHNPFLVALMDSLVGVIHHGMLEARRASVRDRGTLDLRLDQHAELVECIATGRAEEAGELMRRHLAQSQADLNLSLE